MLDIKRDLKVGMGRRSGADKMGWVKGTGVFVITLAIVISYVDAHVGLTFPPARKYDLDFLDAIRTKPPCGMPKGTLKTSLLSGSKFNVTWHLSYPHRGGYRLELLDHQERQLLDLTPKTATEEFIKGDPTAQAHMVELPKGFVCDDCTIRLLRQANEWANNYRFWSCADVDIVDQKNYKETCSGNGRTIAGRCVCTKPGSYGSRCQYEDECETEKQCNNNGKCVHLGGTALPRKQCFCNPGFHGDKCSKRNSVKLPTQNQGIDITGHSKRQLSDRMTLYHKVIPSAKDEDREIEFVLMINGTSYGAIGWRSAGIAKTCKGFPYIPNLPGSSSSQSERQGKSKQSEPVTSESKPEPAAESEPKSEAEPTSESEPKSEAEPKSEPQADSTVAEPHPEAESEAEPEVTSTAKSSPFKQVSQSRSSTVSRSPGGRRYRRETDKKAGEAHAEPEAEAEPEGEPHADSEPEPETASTKTHEHAVAEPESEAEPKAEGEPEPKSEPEGEAEPKSEAEAEAESEPGASDHHHHHKHGDASKKYVVTEWSPKVDFHAMDCIDLVMGGARDGYSRIRDYYTRDRSTPRVDTFWGGSEDITSATGWEKDGQTVLIFRRKILAEDDFDHDLTGELHLIWARGQEPEEYYHRPASGLEKEMPSVPAFYARDEIKYHGHGTQRGITRANLLKEYEVLVNGGTTKNAGEKDSCLNSWSYPTGCVSITDEKNRCSYVATWEYQPSSSSLKFVIQTTQENKWTGIGFAASPSMINADAVIGWASTTGQFFMFDSFMTTRAPPALDTHQDISEMSGSYVDGIQEIRFTRPLTTQDNKDIQLDQCQFFLFPVLGGKYNAQNKKISKHEQVPLTSYEKVCIPTKCKAPKAPALLRYQVGIKLTDVNQFDGDDRPKRTESVAQLTNRIKRELESKFKTVKGYSSLELNDVKVGPENEIEAQIHLNVAPKSDLADEDKLKQYIMDTVVSGQAGASYKVEPTYLRLVSDDPDVVEAGANDGTREFLNSYRIWIVVGCVAVLIVLAIVQAIITIAKNGGKSNSQKGSRCGSSGMAWRDYSDTNYGYDAYEEKQYNTNMMQMQANPVHTDMTNSRHAPQMTRAVHSHDPTGQNYDSIMRNGNDHHYSQNHAHRNGYSTTDGSHLDNSTAPPSYRSLQRGPNPPPSHHPYGGGMANAPSGNLQKSTDFYFMPSQRKYSGEVVRVFVDHNNKRE